MMQKFVRLIANSWRGVNLQRIVARKMVCSSAASGVDVVKAKKRVLKYMIISDVTKNLAMSVDSAAHYRSAPMRREPPSRILSWS